MLLFLMAGVQNDPDAPVRGSSTSFFAAGAIFMAVLLVTYLLIGYYRLRDTRLAVERTYVSGWQGSALTPEKEAEFQRDLQVFLKDVREIALSEYERGYDEQLAGTPESPWVPVKPSEDRVMKSFENGNRGAYLAGRADAKAGKPNRVQVWREAGGTVDGELPKLRDRPEEK